MSRCVLNKFKKTLNVKNKTEISFQVIGQDYSNRLVLLLYKIFSTFFCTMYVIHFFSNAVFKVNIEILFSLMNALVYKHRLGLQPPEFFLKN